MIEETDTSFKENIKSKRFLTKNTNETWDTMKRPNLRIIEIEEEYSELKSPENIFNKTIVENFPNLKKDIPVRTLNRLDQKIVLPPTM